MLSSSSLACCCASTSLDISEILRRITPIDFYPGFIVDDNATCPSQKGTLLVDSNQFLFGELSFPTCDGTGIGTTIDGNQVATNLIIAENIVANNSIFIGENQITSNGPILELPCGTTVCGVPIGASTQYFVMIVYPTSGQQSNLPNTSAGDYIVGGFFQNGYLSFVQYVYYWPLLFSTDATITSLAIYFNVAMKEPEGLPLTANNFVAEIRIRNQDGSIVNTGQTVTLAETVVNNQSYYVAIEGLSYDVIAGQRAGVYLSWNGQLANSEIYNFSWITYNIGYLPKI